MGFTSLLVLQARSVHPVLGVIVMALVLLNVSTAGNLGRFWDLQQIQKRGGVGWDRGLSGMGPRSQEASIALLCICWWCRRPQGCWSRGVRVGDEQDQGRVGSPG